MGSFNCRNLNLFYLFTVVVQAGATYIMHRVSSGSVIKKKKVAFGNYWSGSLLDCAGNKLYAILLINCALCQRRLDIIRHFYE